jgi:hypothetical protein
MCGVHQQVSGCEKIDVPLAQAVYPKETLRDIPERRFPTNRPLHKCVDEAGAFCAPLPIEMSAPAAMANTFQWHVRKGGSFVYTTTAPPDFL